MSDNLLKTLGEYVAEVFDTDKDGIVSFKEFMNIFPSSAIAIALLVIDLLVLVAEYRVWDFGMHITGDPYKAAGFVVVSGFPFYLAQVLWLYPRATWWQRLIAVGMGGASLYTSATFGLADLSLTYQTTSIFQIIVYLTIGYVVALLIYVVNDPGIKARRTKTQAREAAVFQREINEITRSVLNDLRESLEEEKKLKEDFEPRAVQDQLNRLRGQKSSNTQSRNQQPSTMRPAFNKAINQPSIDEGDANRPN